MQTYIEKLINIKEEAVGSVVAAMFIGVGIAVGLVNGMGLN